MANDSRADANTTTGDLFNTTDLNAASPQISTNGKLPGTILFTATNSTTGFAGVTDARPLSVQLRDSSGAAITPATSTLQTSGNASLTSIDAKTPALVLGAVPVTLGGTQAVSLASGAVIDLGAQADAAAASDSSTASLISLFKRLLVRITALIGQLPTALTGSGNLKVSIEESTATQAVSGTVSTNQAGTWSMRLQDGSGNAITSAVRGSERPMSVQIVDASGNQVTTFGGSGGTASNFGSAFPSSGTAIGAKDSAGTSMAALNLDASGNLKVNVAAGGASGGTSSSFGSAVPATGTAAGFSDGTNMQSPRVFDADTGAGTQYVMGAVLRKSASGGSVELGTATDPVRTDPTGSTTQPVSGTVSISGTVTVDTEMAAAGALADAAGNPTTTTVGGANLVYNGTNWDRLRGTTTNGAYADLRALAGTTIDTNSGNKSAGTMRVVLATDQPTMTNPQPVTAAQSTPGNLQMVSQPHTSGGLTPYKLIAAGSTNATSVKASAGQLYEIVAENFSTSIRYLKIYDKATSPTVGTDTPIWTIAIPPASASGQVGGVSKTIPKGIALANGLAIALTTGLADSDTGGVTANDVVLNLGYK